MTQHNQERHPGSPERIRMLGPIGGEEFRMYWECINTAKEVFGISHHEHHPDNFAGALAQQAHQTSMNTLMNVGYGAAQGTVDRPAGAWPSYEQPSQASQGQSGGLMQYSPEWPAQGPVSAYGQQQVAQSPDFNYGVTQFEQPRPQPANGYPEVPQFVVPNDYFANHAPESQWGNMR